jgi:replicative DNA helicase
VLLFSLEMSHLELSQRLLCSEARVDATRIRNGRLLEADWGKISEAIGRLGDAPIYIDDNPNVTVMDIRAKARRLKAREGLGLVVVDYLQLMSGHQRSRAENRQVEVSEISRGLKVLARELDIPVVALSQLSRNLEMRQDKRPVLADLRESGCLTAETRIMRADTGTEVTMGELCASGERDLTVWALDDGMRMVTATMTHVFESGTKRVFELTLASGRAVRASANHPFRTVLGWRRLDELGVGDRLATPRALPTPCRPAALAESELVAMARALSDPDSVAVRSVPTEVWAVHNEQLAVFLRHLWAASGTLEWSAPVQPRCCFVTESRRLAADVQSLLLRFGVVAQLTSAAHEGAAPMYRVQVRGASDLLQFLDEVGVPPELDEIAAVVRHHLVASSSDIGRDVVPSELWRKIRVTLEGAGVDPRALSAAMGWSSWGGGHPHFEPSRPVARQLAALLEDDELRQVAESDVFWDEIVAIDDVGEEPVYDATVLEHHNFVANGIVAHNSIEQDSDVVMFIYRDELYNPDSTQRGAAEIIIAKHRNGPTGTVSLAFMDHHTRFANMARA